MSLARPICPRAIAATMKSMEKRAKPAKSLALAVPLAAIDEEASFARNSPIQK